MIMIMMIMTTLVSSMIMIMIGTMIMIMMITLVSSMTATKLLRELIPSFPVSLQPVKYK